MNATFHQTLNRAGEAGNNQRAGLNEPGTVAAVETRTNTTNETGKRRFRGASLEEAVAAANAELGEVRVLGANRLRRGGIGGFFTTEIGVEIEVEAVQPRNTAETAEADTGRRDVKEPTVPSGGGLDALVADRIDRLVTSKPNQPTSSLPRQLRQPSDVTELVVERLDERERQAQERAIEAAQRERAARAEAQAAAERERQARAEAEAAVERERIATTTASLDAERRRSAQLEVERDRAMELAMNERTRAAAEVARTQAERQAAEQRATELQMELVRAERERAAAELQTDLMRDALKRKSEENLAAAKLPAADESYGIAVLGRLGVPERIVDRVRAGSALSAAIPVGDRVGDPGNSDGLIVLVGPAGVVRERQRQLAQRCSVADSDLAFATMRELVSRDSVGVRVLRDEDDVAAWVDGRKDPHRTCILAIEWNASPGWTTGVRKIGRGAANGQWRLVLPASFSGRETRTLLHALAMYRPHLDIVAAQQSVLSCAQMLEFADRIMTVDGEPHSGSLWASLLWERACQL